MIGLDPGPYTLRELYWMAEGRGRADWSQTSEVLAMLFNVNRDPAKVPFRPAADFNPFEAAKAKTVHRVPLAAMKGYFVQG